MAEGERERTRSQARQPGMAAIWVPRIALGALILVCALGGGSARADAVSLIYVRPVIVLALAALLLARPEARNAGLRAPAFLLCALLVAILVQLIPVPPSVWGSLPGHQPIFDGAVQAGLESPWRPISLTPELTLNSAIALLPAAAMLIALWVMAPREQSWFVAGLLVIAGLSCALGLVQMASGGAVGHFYAVTSEGLPTGFFSNRNHQAAFLAACIPLLVVWLQSPPARRQQAGHRRSPTGDALAVRASIAAMGAMLFVITILMTGSRSGTLLAMAAILFVAVQAAPQLRRTGWRTRLVFIVLMLLLAALVAAFALAGRSLSLSRLSLLDEGSEADPRFTALPTVLRIAGDFMPLGSGFGSFDPVFRIYEADADLSATYFNHAHNDLVELAMTGGIPALVVLGAFLLWWVWRTIVAWRSDGHDPRVRLARGASAAIAILLGASLSDYPLRTPLLTLVFALLCGWLAIGSRRREQTAGSPVANAKTSG